MAPSVTEPLQHVGSLSASLSVSIRRTVVFIAGVFLIDVWKCSKIEGGREGEAFFLTNGSIEMKYRDGRSLTYLLSVIFCGLKASVRI